MRRIAFLTSFLLLAVFLAVTSVRADENEVRDAQLRTVEDGLVLDADFDFDPPRMSGGVFKTVDLD